MHRLQPPRSLPPPRSRAGSLAALARAAAVAAALLSACSAGGAEPSAPQPQALPGPSSSAPGADAGSSPADAAGAPSRSDRGGPAAPGNGTSNGISSAAGSAIDEIVRGSADSTGSTAPTAPDGPPAPSTPQPRPGTGTGTSTSAAAPGAAPRDDDFIDVAAAIPDAVLDMRYATEHNFTKRKLYPVARCLLRRAVATRLAAAAARLREEGRRIVLWDCYRPASIQLALWELVPDPAYVARPKFADDGTPIGGSRHSRGAAVDISLAGEDGTPLTMPTDHDDFSSAAQPKRAFAAKPGGAEARRLATAMKAEGFVPITSEWWHFDAPDSARYGFSDAPLQ